MQSTVVENGISANADDSLNFGNYLSKEKIKVKDFDVNGHMYSVKTHNEVTRLEQNGQLLVECVPGAAFWNFTVSEAAVTCHVKGLGQSNLTLELSPETIYVFYVDGVKIGETKSGISGKISFSADLKGEGVDIRILKMDV